MILQSPLISSKPSTIFDIFQIKLINIELTWNASNWRTLNAGLHLNRIAFRSDVKKYLSVP
jgi:hypothetical protein